MADAGDGEACAMLAERAIAHNMSKDRVFGPSSSEQESHRHQRSETQPFHVPDGPSSLAPPALEQRGSGRGSIGASERRGSFSSLGRKLSFGRIRPGNATAESVAAIAVPSSLSPPTQLDNNEADAELVCEELDQAKLAMPTVVLPSLGTASHQLASSAPVFPVGGTSHAADVAESPGVEQTWTCVACTMEHLGEAKMQYLACEVCGTERPVQSNSTSGSDSTSTAANHPVNVPVNSSSEVALGGAIGCPLPLSPASLRRQQASVRAQQLFAGFEAQAALDAQVAAGKIKIASVGCSLCSVVPRCYRLMFATGVDVRSCSPSAATFGRRCGI